MSEKEKYESHVPVGTATVMLLMFSALSFVLGVFISNIFMSILQK